MTGGTAEPVLAISRLAVSYGGKPAVRDVSLSIGPGEAVAVIGSNGAGKTSMLRGIMGLASVAAERLVFAGRAIAGLPAQRIARLGIGYVPEGRELFPGLTVEEELLIGSRKLSRAERADRFEEVFDLFPRLKERLRQVTRTMSGGEQQMLAIARVLLRAPKLLLLDEPSLGLGPIIQDAVYGALAALRQRGLPMLLVEQNAFRALNACDRAYVLELGSITREGASCEFLDDPSIRAAYLGS
jgi:branched-chain amino acid transport system ATP-binding protein